MPDPALLLDDGSVALATVSALGMIGGLVVERVLLHVQPRWYFAVGIPLGEQLVPIPSPPEGEGETATVRWKVDEPVVHFWADPRQRRAPSGLHGVIWLSRQRGAVHLDVRWSPPWSPMLAALWLAGLGAWRGEPQLTVPIACMLVVGVLVLYRQAAVRAARELRWSFVNGGGAP